MNHVLVIVLLVVALALYFLGLFLDQERTAQSASSSGRVRVKPGATVRADVFGVRAGDTALRWDQVLPDYSSALALAAGVMAAVGFVAAAGGVFAGCAPWVLPLALLVLFVGVFLQIVAYWVVNGGLRAPGSAVQVHPKPAPAEGLYLLIAANAVVLVTFFVWLFGHGPPRPATAVEVTPASISV